MAAIDTASEKNHCNCICLAGNDYTGLKYAGGKLVCHDKFGTILSM